MANNSERFLIVRLSSLGDLVHSLPVLSALRASFPEARIDWVVDARWSALIKLVDGVDEVIPLPHSILGVARCVRRLRHGRYSCALDIQSRYRSAVLAWLSGAPRRIGRHAAATREPGAARFYTERVLPTGQHVAEMNLGLAIEAGAHPSETLEFPLRVPRDSASRRLREQILLQGFRDYVILSPGAGWGSKCWPPERFGALAAELWKREGLPSLVNIAPGEQQLAADLLRAADNAKALVVCPSVEELVVLLSEARLVVAGDSGPLHLAAALNVQVLGLFGDTDAARNGPLPSGVVVQNVSTAPPMYLRGDYLRGATPSRAMLSITVDQVLAAAQQQLAKLRSGAAANLP
jgi:heptosyltransferase I